MRLPRQKYPISGRRCSCCAQCVRGLEPELYKVVARCSNTFCARPNGTVLSANTLSLLLNRSQGWQGSGVQSGSRGKVGAWINNTIQITLHWRGVACLWPSSVVSAWCAIVLWSSFHTSASSLLFMVSIIANPFHFLPALLGLDFRLQCTRKGNAVGMGCCVRRKFA